MYKVEMVEADFPIGPLPSQGKPGSYDMRKFKAGEPVALRIPMLPDVTTGTYVEPQPSFLDNKIYTHVINFNHPAFGQINMLVFWDHIGKIRQPVSATAANFIAGKRVCLRILQLPLKSMVVRVKGAEQLGALTPGKSQENNSLPKSRMENCIFPQLPVPKTGQPGSYDTRRFKVGEPVCLRNQVLGIVTGTYVGPNPQPDTGYTYVHVVRSDVPGAGPIDRWVSWRDVGKIAQPVSATAVNAVVRNSPLPLNLASLLKKYGGGKRRRTLRKKLRFLAKTKKRNHPPEKLKNRRRTRRN